MKGIFGFFMGLVIGAFLMLGALRYHVVRADDGVHLVPKVSAQLGETYVDIRGFDINDWNQHRGLAVALTQAGKGELMQASAGESVRQAVDQVLAGLKGQ